MKGLWNGMPKNSKNRWEKIGENLLITERKKDEKEREKERESERDRKRWDENECEKKR